MARMVTLTFEVIEHRTGLWCRDCALSSGVALTLAMTRLGAVSLSTVRRCADCGGDGVE